MNYLFNKKNWHICEEKFWDNNNDNDRNKCKFRDHCHFTGKHRGAAYSICNLKYKIPERYKSKKEQHKQCKKIVM